MAGKIRKTHSKSRDGCLRCKSRRVKCDEQRPSCGMCQKRKEACVFEYTVRSTSTPNSAASPLPPLPHPQDTSRIRELELMHCWTSNTFQTVSSEEKRFEYQVTIPELALTHDYLLDVIFAISALHIVAMRPESAHPYRVMALEYHSRSITAFRPALEAMSPERHTALLHCSIMLGIIAIALRDGSASPVDTLCQLAHLWRGTAHIWRAGEKWKIDSADCTPTGSDQKPISPPDTETPPQDLRPPVVAFLRHLREEATQHHDPETYLSSIDLLEPVIALAQDNFYTEIFKWPVTIKPEMVYLIEQRDHLACAITLLFCCHLRGMEDAWWANNFNRLLVDELASRVAASEAEAAAWNTELEWARSLWTDEP